MQNIIDSLRSVIGTPDFYIQSGSYNSWDYGALLEYFFAGLILCIVISSVFKFLLNLLK